MDYQQYRKMRRLVHKCCNYDDGFCITLDDGEKCVCVQSISYSLKSASGFVPRYCQWIGSWKPLSFPTSMPSSVQYAGNGFFPVLTVRNTVRIAPQL